MFRTVLVKKSSKMQSMQSYLVIYDGEDETRVYLKDIDCLLIEASNSLITIPLLVDLIKNNISVIICDEKHNPVGTVLGFNNNYRSAGNVYLQLDWEEERSLELWTKIVKTKIEIQLAVLRMLNKPNQDILEKYIKEVEYSDQTNREGLAAKTYFFALFGQDFNRKEQNIINDLLDYGYSIILSCFNREIVRAGYLTQLGIFHQGKTNPFNLSCDFMEPFRPIVDIIAYDSIYLNNPIVEIRKILTKKVLINNEERFISDAIGVYVGALLRILNGEDVSLPTLVLKEKEHYFSDKSYENNSNV